MIYVRKASPLAMPVQDLWAVRMRDYAPTQHNFFCYKSTLRR